MAGGVYDTPGMVAGTDTNGLYLAILQISQVITSAPRIDEVYEKFALELKTLVDFDRANIATIDPTAGTLTIAYNFGQQMVGSSARQTKPLEGSRAGMVLATGKTVVQNDVATVYPRRASDAAALQVGLLSAMAVPLACQGQVIGALSVRSRRIGAFGPREQTIIEHLARLIAPAVDRARLSEWVGWLIGGREDAEDLQERTTEKLLDASGLYDAILEISGVIAHSPPIDQVYEQFTQALKKLVDFDRASFTTIDAAKGAYTIAYSYGEQVHGASAGRVMPLEGSRTGSVMVTQETIIEDDVATLQVKCAADGKALEVGLRSSIFVPLICHGQVIGALSIRSRRVGAFGPREQSIIEHLARLIAPAVDRALLSERVDRLPGGREDGGELQGAKTENLMQAPSAVPTGEENGLSPREREVLALLTKGAGNREIGEALSISPNTVKTHIRGILGKLKARNRTEAALAGRQQVEIV